MESGAIAFLLAAGVVPCLPRTALLRNVASRPGTGLGLRSSCVADDASELRAKAQSRVVAYQSLASPPMPLCAAASPRATRAASAWMQPITARAEPSSFTATTRRTGVIAQPAIQRDADQSPRVVPTARPLLLPCCIHIIFYIALPTTVGARVAA